MFSLQQRSLNRIADRRGPVYGAQRLTRAKDSDQRHEEKNCFLRD